MSISIGFVNISATSKDLYNTLYSLLSKKKKKNTEKIKSQLTYHVANLLGMGRLLVQCLAVISLDPDIVPCTRSLDLALLLDAQIKPVIAIYVKKLYLLLHCQMHDINSISRAESLDSKQVQLITIHS